MAYSQDNEMRKDGLREIERGTWDTTIQRIQYHNIISIASQHHARYHLIREVCHNRLPEIQYKVT